MAIRACVQGAVIRNGRILVEEFSGEHAKGNGFYYRTLGGGIELGETSREAIVREFREELGAEIRIEEYLGCLENIWTVAGGGVGHEWVQMYRVALADESFYEQERVTITEGDETFYGIWVPVEEFLNGERTLYPNGLTEMLAALKAKSA